MFPALNRFLALFAADTPRADAVPRALLEVAGARAGRDPRQARELRAAAVAAMRVVR